MEDQMWRIAWYHRLFLVCLVLAALCLLAAVILYFVLDIRGVLGYLTGRDARRKIRERGERMRNKMQILLFLAVPAVLWLGGPDSDLMVRAAPEQEEAANPEEPPEPEKAPEPEESPALVITVRDGETCIENGETVYLNREALTDGRKTYEISVTEDGEERDDLQAAAPEFVPKDEEQSETAVLTTVIQDHEGNEVSHSFTVVYDVEEPVIERIMVTDGTKESADGIFTNQAAVIKAAVSDENLKEAVLVNAEHTEERLVMEKSEEDGYTHVCTISADMDKRAVYRIEAVDLAGNSVLGDEIYVETDRTAPMLAVTWPDCTGSGNGKKYYRPDEGEAEETVTLTFTESNFEKQTDENGDPIKPTIHILKNGEEERGSDSYVSWKPYADGRITAEVFLPYEAGEEVSYQIRAEYRDAAGNPLFWDEDAFGLESGEEGFLSGILILDDKAPELQIFSVNGESHHTAEDGTPIFVNKGDAGDVQISFGILESLEGWNPKGAALQVIRLEKDQEVIVGECPEISWQESAGLHMGSCMVAGEAGIASKYAVRLSYTDRAGNVLTLSADAPVRPGSLEGGVYTSDTFILDHSAPVFEINFNEAFRLMDSDHKDYPAVEKTPVSGMTSYYGKAQGKIELAVRITEEYFIKDMENGIAEFEFRVNGVSKPVEWSLSGNTYTGIYTISEEGDYTVEIFYEDAAENKMIQKDAGAGGKVVSGKYTSPALVLDTTAPKVSAEYTAAAVHICEEQGEHQGRRYFDSPAALQIMIDDQNIRCEELKEVISGLKAADMEGNRIESEAEHFIKGLDDSRIHRPVNGAYPGPWTVTIPLYTDANYDIPVAFTDLAGNAAEYDKVLKSCTDRTEPKELSLTWSVSPSGFLDAVNYKDLGFVFADGKLTIHADAKDQTAGIRRIRFMVTDENGGKTEWEELFSPGTSVFCETVLPLKTKDFKGTVTVEATDWSGNKRAKTRGYIVESQEKHLETKSAVIATKTSPSRTVAGKDFYNQDVTFHLTLKDTWSGLRSCRYTGGNTLSGGEDYAKRAGADLDKTPAEEITYEFSKDMTLIASENNENDVKVSASYVDNAGHTGSVEQFYNIDITKPVITVEYDQDEPANGRFYSQPRTAKVTIQERNFDAQDVEFAITSTEGAMPVIGSWSQSGQGDDTKHVCHVTFLEDGDYTFSVAFEDMAGNRADYDRVDEFTIDRTKPVLTVTYDNNRSMHEHYYAEKRTATIDILEHNFDPALAEVTVTAEGAAAPLVSDFRRVGDHSIAAVSFEEDGEYMLRISGTDQAGNPMDDYETDLFVIDRTAPKLEIFGVEDGSANRGTVMPEIRCYDTNYDAGNTMIRMTGCHSGEQKIDGETVYTENGLDIRMTDFAYVPEADDLYTLEASACDLAGNQSEARIVFSVNRFGSVYAFDAATDRLAGKNGKYYTNREQDIVVTETNVDTLKFREITCNLNGDLRTLTEGEDYAVRMSGSDMSWKQYTYTIYRKNFEKEGTYILTIYSEDQADNASDNNTGGKKVEFAVDKTSPSIIISGVEDGGQYRENSREVTLDVQDNLQLERVEVDVDGVRTIYSASDLADAEGRLVIQLDHADHWQNISVSACDMAGNKETLGEIRFLLTPNIFIQFFMNKLLFYSVLGILLLAAAGTLCFWRGMK